jgi:uncharacterized protein (TIGR03382 family)
VGDYVVGITSRAYAGVSWDTPCLEGGIYVRPDAILDWAEEVSGKTLTYPNCNAEPTLWADTIYAPSGGTGDTFIDVDDPDGKNEKATFAIVQQPEFGTAEITETGQVLYTANAGYTGSDTVTVSVTDAARAKYPRSGGSNTLEFDIPIEVSNTPMAAAPGVEGETDTTTEPAGCGCQSTGTSGGLAVLLAPLLVALRRRKRSV